MSVLQYKAFFDELQLEKYTKHPKKRITLYRNIAIQ